MKEKRQLRRPHNPAAARVKRRSIITRMDPKSKRPQLLSCGLLLLGDNERHHQLDRVGFGDGVRLIKDRG